MAFLPSLSPMQVNALLFFFVEAGSFVFFSRHVSRVATTAFSNTNRIHIDMSFFCHCLSFIQPAHVSSSGSNRTVGTFTPRFCSGCRTMTERLASYMERHRLCRRTVQLLAEHGHLAESFLTALRETTAGTESGWSRCSAEPSGVRLSSSIPEAAPSSGGAPGPYHGPMPAPGPEMLSDGSNPLCYYRFQAKPVYHHRSCHQLKRNDVSVPRRLTICNCVEIESAEEKIVVDSDCRLHQDQFCPAYKPVYDRSGNQRLDQVSHCSACLRARAIEHTSAS